MRELLGHGWYSNKDHGPMYRIPATIVQTVDRLQRLFQYALRMLLALRRTKLPVVVTSSSQPRLSAGPQADSCTETPKEECTT
jgi:hypothetical protein